MFASVVLGQGNAGPVAPPSTFGNVLETLLIVTPQEQGEKTVLTSGAERPRMLLNIHSAQNSPPNNYSVQNDSSAEVEKPRSRLLLVNKYGIYEFMTHGARE